VISNPYRHLFAARRINGIATGEHSRLILTFSLTLNFRLFNRLIDISSDRFTALIGRKFTGEYMLRCEHEKRSAEDRVRTCRKDSNNVLFPIHYKFNFSTFTATYPVLLCAFNLFRPIKRWNLL